jgi:hypothetical protein
LHHSLDVTNKEQSGANVIHAPAIYGVRSERSNVRRLFVWHTMQILPNAAYLQRSCRTGASERVPYNRQYWRQLGNNRGTKLPPTLIFAPLKSAPECGFSALGEDHAGRRYVLLVMTRDGTAMKKLP